MEDHLSPINANLQRLSMITIAKSLWETEAIKQEIEDFFRNLPRKSESLYQYNDWYIIVAKVLQNLKLLKLPVATSKSLEDLIVYMGENLIAWCEHVIFTLELTLRYIRRIYWTPYGIIDDYKIYKLYWLKMGILVDLEPNFYIKPYSKPIYILACIYVDEKFIEDSLPEMTDEMRKIYPEVNIDNYSDKIYTLISLFLYFHFIRRREKGYFSTSDHVIPVKQMYNLCEIWTLSKAAKYFFNKLNKNLQQPSVRATNRIRCLIHMAYNRKHKFRHGHRKLFDLLIFLMKNMEGEEKREFLANCHLLVVLSNLHFWLYPEMITPFLNSDCPLPENDCSIMEYEALFRIIISLIKDNIKENCPVRKPILNDLLYHVWGKIPNNRKFEIIGSYTFGNMSLINKIFDVFDFEFIKSLFADSDLQKGGLIDGAVRKCKSLVESGEHLLVLDFIRDVLPSNERANFYVKANHLEDLIIKDDYETVELFIDTLSNCIENKTKAQIKRDIKGFTICRKFAERSQFELVDKYLRWQFDTEQERQNFKTMLKSNDQIYSADYSPDSS